MNADAGKKFLAAVRNALGRPGDIDARRDRLFDTRAGDPKLQAQWRNRSAAEQQQLLRHLEEAAVAINLGVVAVTEAPEAGREIAALVSSREPEWGPQKQVVAWRHPLVEALNLPQALAEQGVPVTFMEAAEQPPSEEERRRLRTIMAGALVGVTGAEYCVASSATLVLDTGAGRPRSISLLPSIHVAVIGREQIVADLGELYARIKADPRYESEGLGRCLTFITGPSKTADIEATMVHGAHGPREVIIYVIGR